jgi:hypothetical protein
MGQPLTPGIAYGVGDGNVPDGTTKRAYPMCGQVLREEGMMICYGTAGGYSIRRGRSNNGAKGVTLADKRHSEETLVSFAIYPNLNAIVKDL